MRCTQSWRTLPEFRMGAPPSQRGRKENTTGSGAGGCGGGRGGGSRANGDGLPLSYKCTQI